MVRNRPLEDAARQNIAHGFNPGQRMPPNALPFPSFVGLKTEEVHLEQESRRVFSLGCRPLRLTDCCKTRCAICRCRNAKRTRCSQPIGRMSINGPSDSRLWLRVSRASWCVSRMERARSEGGTGGCKTYEDSLEQVHRSSQRLPPRRHLPERREAFSDYPLSDNSWAHHWLKHGNTDILAGDGS
jgi:hypothetical protein